MLFVTTPVHVIFLQTKKRSKIIRTGDFLAIQKMLGTLVSHYSAIGDIMSCDPPYSTIGFRGKFFSAMRPPLLGLSLDCDRPVLRRKEVGV